MKVRLIARVERLERVEARAAADVPIQLQIGYLKRLPADYQGERHVVTVGQQPAGGMHPGRYEFEERPGSAPTEFVPVNILRVCLVSVVAREQGVDRVLEARPIETGAQ
jgi:hypothetical protein